MTAAIFFTISVCEGILLKTTGCVETTVDYERVIDTMLLNVEQNKSKKIKEEVS